MRLNRIKLTSLTLAAYVLGAFSAPAMGTTVLDQLMGGQKATQAQALQEKVLETVAPIEMDENGYPVTARGYWLAPMDNIDQAVQDYISVVDVGVERQTNRSIDFKQLPFELSIVRTKGDGSRLLAVIVDPSCPYCRMLEEEVAKLDNITVFTFVTSILGGSQKLVNQIQCAGDGTHEHRALAYDYFSKNQTHLFTNTDAACVQTSTISDRIKKSIEGYKDIDRKTPTVIFPSDVFVSSAMTKEQIEEILNLYDGSEIVEQAVQEQSLVK